MASALKSDGLPGSGVQVTEDSPVCSPLVAVIGPAKVTVNWTKSRCALRSERSVVPRNRTTSPLRLASRSMVTAVSPKASATMLPSCPNWPAVSPENVARVPTRVARSSSDGRPGVLLGAVVVVLAPDGGVDAPAGCGVSR